MLAMLEGLGIGCSELEKYESGRKIGLSCSTRLKVKKNVPTLLMRIFKPNSVGKVK
jgi:hypothetical protein